VRVRYYVPLFVLPVIFLFVVVVFRQHVVHASENKLVIVCTTGMIADIVRKIGGNLIMVHGLMGPGVDPHLYRATEGDMHKLMAADIIFYNGLHLEGKMADLFKQMNKYIKTIAVADALEPAQLIMSPDMPDIYDPHIWFDVQLWMHVVQLIGDTLCAVDDDEVHQINYTQRTQALLHELAMLHIYVQSRVAEIPEPQRILVTAHDAFSYFGRAYGIRVIGLQGISTDADISAKDVQDLVELIVAHHIPALFVESSITHRTLHAVQDAVTACGSNVMLGDELFSDALGDSDTQAGTYIGMVRHNVDAMASALRGSA
jgi:manganese/zinc/iron transport system substrate-binding protein